MSAVSVHIGQRGAGGGMIIIALPIPQPLDDGHLGQNPGLCLEAVLGACSYTAVQSISQTTDWQHVQCFMYNLAKLNPTNAQFLALVPDTLTQQMLPYSPHNTR